MTVVQVVQCSRCTTKRNTACAPLAKALGPVQGCIHMEEGRLFLTYTKALYELASRWDTSVVPKADKHSPHCPTTATTPRSGQEKASVC